MTGGLIQGNTAGSYPAISGDVTFNNLAVVQINAEGTTVSVETAKAGMADYSYVKPVMPDNDKLGPLMELSAAVAEAETYRDMVGDNNPALSGNMSTLIDGGKNLLADPASSKTSIEIHTDLLLLAIEAAKHDLALKRVIITIPAKSYVARIDADQRQIEMAVEGVSLYSVKNVTDSEVELTAALSVVGAEMPYLIYNDKDTEVTVNIVISSDAADAVTYDSEHFKGTLVDKTFTDADMQFADHYVLTGKNFVWVKDAGTLAAGKCWIELVPASESNARALSIVFEGGLANAISGIDADKTNDNEPWYTIGGARLTGKPTAPGIYIQGKKKILVK